MRTLQAMTTAGLLLLAACGQKNNTKPPEKTPTPTSATKPAETPASTATPTPAAQPICRALVNVLFADGPGVADIKISATSTMESATGAYVMVADGQTFAVQLAEFSAKDKNTFGSLSRDWSEIAITSMPGETKLVTKLEPEITLPDEGAVTNEFEMTKSVRVMSLIGPYLSLSIGDSGFTGGAHEYDDSHYVTLKMPEGKPFPLDALKAEAMTEIKAKITSEDELRKKDVGDDAEPLPVPEDFSRWAFSFREDDKAGLYTAHLLSCCSWAENRNMHELKVPLSKAPSVLQSSLSLSADQKWIEAPSGCGAVSLEGNAIKVRAGKDGAAQDLGAAGVVMGVYWVDEKSTFSAKSLPKPIAKVSKENPATP